MRLSGLFATIAVYVMLVLALLPIVWMVRTSVEGASGLVSTAPLLWPTAPTLLDADCNHLDYFGAAPGVRTVRSALGL